ncbi:TnsA endonuclease N-terminal domain-containing protein [Methylomonas sp. EFPC3]|uniref:TnsA endonuclease N-terminal domain-containing protein n=1 Tax=Methylomonas sp. EFPC3 TaxID=3021710 RepID=UPI00241648C5|nr:TnsA endonuclease N-terminal domain-containing protein [Methylomonas sp. EFPC3]WFP49284.1 TnsA endonuclease N-terminal domain-containing protein [Methylomonas sp. EFPC3]
MSIEFDDQRQNAGRRPDLRLIITPQPKALRAREPVTRSRGKVRGEFPSTKMNRSIAWESQNEQKACYHFEFSPVVKAFREQPQTFYLPAPNGMCRYTPDFELTFQSGEICYVEVKPLSKLFTPKVLEPLQAANQFLAEKGYCFIVLTEDELNFPNRIRNFSILRPYLRFEIPLHISERAQAWVTRCSNPTIAELSCFVGMQTTAFALLAQLCIRFDFDQPLENCNGQQKPDTCLGSVSRKFPLEFDRGLIAQC